MIQVQFHKSDPWQFVAECKMPSIPDPRDTIVIDEKIYEVVDSNKHWKICMDTIWVVEVSVIQVGVRK